MAVHNTLLLDKNKKIIAKLKTVEQLVRSIETLTKKS